MSGRGKRKRNNKGGGEECSVRVKRKKRGGRDSLPWERGEKEDKEELK